MVNPVVKAGASLLEETIAKKEAQALESTAVKTVADSFAPIGAEAVAKPAETTTGSILGASAAVGATTVLGTEASAQETDPLADKIKSAFSEGYSKDEIISFMAENMKDSMPVEAITKKVNAIANPNREGADTPDEVKAMDLADKYKNIHEKYSDTAKWVGAVLTNDSETIHNLNKDRRELNQYIANELKTVHGVNAFTDPDSGELVMQTEDGKVQPVDSSFMNTIFNSGFEFGGAIAGAAMGGRTGAAALSAVTPPVLPGVGPLAKPIAAAVGGAGGALIGGAVGAFGGRGIDLLKNAYSAKEDLDAGFALQQMVEAGAADGVTSVLGGAIFKAGKGVIAGTSSAWNLMTRGNTSGAYKALLDTAGISKQEASDIVANWEKLNQMPAPGATDKEKAIAVIAQTDPRAEGLTRTAISSDPQASAKLVQGIDQRAKGLISAIDKAEPNNVATALREGLDGYKKDVQDFYGLVKQEAVDIVDHTDYRFNFEKTAIKPVLDKIGATLDNPQVKERFVGMMNKINRLSETRTFSDLVELRQTVNDFKYNTKVVRHSDKVALNTALNKIDSEIAKTAKEYMPNNGKDWINNFSKAKTEYAKMFQLEDNALVKTLSKPGVTEGDIQRVIPKYMNSVDGTFNQVLEKLAPAVRAKTEAAAIKHLTEKWTSGIATDLQAVHFPALAEDLKALPLATSQGKALANAVSEMAKVYKNDPSLSKLGGQFYVREGGNTLTTDLTAKAKYAVAGAVWNHVVKVLPTKSGRNASLIAITAKLLENPMKAKTVDDLLKGFKGTESAEMRSLVKDLQVQYTKQAEKPAPDKIKLYKVGSTDKLNASEGAMGRGVYMNERVSNPGVTEQGKKIIKYEVNRSQLADLSKISALVGKDVTVADIRKLPDLQKQLSDQGFVGINHEGRVMLFDDTIIENGIKRKETKTWGDPTM